MREAPCWSPPRVAASAAYSGEGASREIERRYFCAHAPISDNNCRGNTRPRRDARARFAILARVFFSWTPFVGFSRSRGRRVVGGVPDARLAAPRNSRAFDERTPSWWFRGRHQERVRWRPGARLRRRDVGNDFLTPSILNRWRRVVVSGVKVASRGVLASAFAHPRARGGAFFPSQPCVRSSPRGFFSDRPSPPPPPLSLSLSLSLSRTGNSRVRHA